MWRAILLFMSGVFCAALFIGAVSVYVFHDVDKELIGYWNEAFAAQCSEAVLFTVIVGSGVAVLTFLGRLLFRLTGFSPRPIVAYFLGVGITLLQYPWDFASRIALPKFTDALLYAYLIVAIVASSAFIVLDIYHQKKSGLSQG